MTLPLSGRRVAILVAEGVEDLEFFVPLMRLQEEGAEVIAAGLDHKTVRGKNGLEITPTARIDSLESSELFALVLPGGWAPDKLRRHAAVTRLVQEMDVAGKIIGRIRPRRSDRYLGGDRRRQEVHRVARNKGRPGECRSAVG